MTDNINPSHYKDGPFECIELSRLLSSDWGQAVQYCFRWQHKNGVEDLKKALWFVNDALVHGIPIYAVSDWADLASALFHTLAREDWAGLMALGRDREHLAVSCDTRIPSIQDRLTETSVGTGALRR